MTIDDLIPKYLAAQRWFAGAEPPKTAVVAEREEVVERLHWLVVETDGGARWSVPLTSVPVEEVPDFLRGHDAETLGVADGELWFDATLDHELMLKLLVHLAPDESGKYVRPMGVEQSNTSLVIDDRLILKVYRRLHRGPNPDVELPGALAETGFEHVASPLAVWRVAEDDRAAVVPFLHGAAEGWMLALTSLRDLLGGEEDDPARCGGDFGAEAARIGKIIGEMHASLARAFGASPDPKGEGQAIRVHGDLHLGQVLRTDAGWFVIDFEGEPSRPLAERTQLTSPLKDVAGMARSIDYAAAVAVRERGAEHSGFHEVRAAAWVDRNRGAFLAGYLDVDGAPDLLPADLDVRERELRLWELDKARYEVAYEEAHRPEWVDIPLAAVARLEAELEAAP